ncbi:MAG TPA: energy transducer TonB [Lacunisphaera sp.]|nr:energy transducer TonB [Lacunisphaera sp.]
MHPRHFIATVLAILLGAPGVVGAESSRQRVKVDDSIYPVYQFNLEVKPTRTVPPALPPDAYQAGRGGFVLVGALVNEKGRVASTFVAKSTADRDIQHACRLAVGQWRFPKITEGDTVINYVVFIPLELKRNDNE